MSELQTVTHVLSASEVRILGSGSLRELLMLEQIAWGGVYVTDPVVPTFLDPKLTAWDGEDDDDEDDDDEDDDHEDDDDEDRRRDPDHGLWLAA